MASNKLVYNRSDEVGLVLFFLELKKRAMTSQRNLGAISMWWLSMISKLLTTKQKMLSKIFQEELPLVIVWVYKKTSEEKFPTLKKYSDKAPPSDKFASHEVKVDYEYKSILEPHTVVPLDQRIKGYLYGPQVVPISSAEWEAVKFKPEKVVKLLGFADRSSVPRNSYCALQPDSFYFNILPFAEDVREFQFCFVSKLPPSSQPTGEQQEATDNLVKMLDLAPPGREEILRSDFTPNPMLERKKAETQERLAYAGLDGQAKKPEDPSAEKAKGIDCQAKKSEDPDAEKARALEAMFPSTEKAGKIGDLNPVQDFEAMLAERSSSA
ncbi:hypothetical protein ACQ4PT_029879 [Festuca glaucescens]